MEVGEHESAYDGVRKRNHARGIVSAFDEAVPDADAVQGTISAHGVVSQRMAEACVGAAPIVVAPGAVGDCSD